ncbi:CFEM domain-containing protein [Pochonia chlamydosporia 170]|uniref:CFEM domain-containing protein n=1 Tax=Pochonia chlamydosporia 170 TaxID=1380566 RepID=A0A179FXP4_METCM|nr:CFEM domain-containing protein [Pochonia chlamydosporia 170]OAQ69998.1 CFEM domain-containing protein [Pochonia chlamydosporia 170]
MKNSLVLSFIALSSYAIATDDPCLSLTSKFPKCPFSCVSKAAASVGCTNTADLSCQCNPKSSSAIQSLAAGCALAACNPTDLPPAIDAGSSLCACVASHPATTTNAPSTSPTGSTSKPGGSTTSGPAPSTTPTGTGTGTTTGPTVTTGPTCVPSSPCDAVKSKVPACASSCIGSAAGKVGCDQQNLSCQCASSSAIQQAAFNCVSSACGLQTGAAVLQSVAAVCSCVSANPTKPCSGGTQPTTKPSGTESSGPGSSSGPVTSAPACSSVKQPDCGAVASTAIPSCAQQCFTSAAPGVNCQVTDFKCQCQPDAQKKLSTLLLPCVQKNCPPASLPGIIGGASSVCACATAPPGSGVCTTSGGGSAPTSGGQQPTNGTSGGNTSGGQQPTGGSSGSPPPTSSSPVVGGAGILEVSFAGVAGVVVLAAFVL